MARAALTSRARLPMRCLCTATELRLEEIAIMHWRRANVEAEIEQRRYVAYQYEGCIAGGFQTHNIEASSVMKNAQHREVMNNVRGACRSVSA